MSIKIKAKKVLKEPTLKENIWELRDIILEVKKIVNRKKWEIRILIFCYVVFTALSIAAIIYPINSAEICKAETLGNMYKDFFLSDFASN